MIIDDNKSKILIALAYNAGQEIVRIYNKKVTKKLKSDNSPVTNADLKANTIIGNTKLILISFFISFENIKNSFEYYIYI